MVKASEIQEIQHLKVYDISYNYIGHQSVKDAIEVTLRKEFWEKVSKFSSSWVPNLEVIAQIKETVSNIPDVQVLELR